MLLWRHAVHAACGPLPKSSPVYALSEYYSGVAHRAGWPVNEQLLSLIFPSGALGPGFSAHGWLASAPSQFSPPPGASLKHLPALFSRRLLSDISRPPVLTWVRQRAGTWAHDPRLGLSLSATETIER